MSTPARFVRLVDTDRAAVTLRVDGQPITALDGDTLMVALLTAGRHLRRSDCGPETRAGFCLMGACQDCTVWADDGTRLRACATPVTDGLSVRTAPPPLPGMEPA